MSKHRKLITGLAAGIAMLTISAIGASGASAYAPAANTVVQRSIPAI